MKTSPARQLDYPPPISVADLGNIPDPLRSYPNWVNWAYRPDPDDPGHWNKQPVYRVGDKWFWGASTWPHIRVDFYTAAYNALINEDNARVQLGVGFCPTEDTPFTFIDLDKCRDRETGTILPPAMEYVRRLATWTEISVSGRGLHAVVIGKKPGPRCNNREAGVEMYDRLRFVAMTGWLLDGTPDTIQDRQAELAALYHELFPPPAPVPPASPTAADSLRLVLGSASGAATDPISRARAYVACVPGAISGHCGSTRTAHVACLLVIDFALSLDDALTVLREWNATCTPPWSDRELVRKLEWAQQQPGERGRKLRTDRPRRLQPWEEEIAALDGVDLSVLRRVLAHLDTPTAVDATALSAPGVEGAQPPGTDGAAFAAAWAGPGGGDRWAKEHPCPDLREIFLAHRYEPIADRRLVDCHDPACVACRHNAKRRRILNLRHGLAHMLHPDATVHVFTVPVFTRRVWRTIPNRYALAKGCTQYGAAHHGNLVISVDGPPAGRAAAAFHVEEVSQAEAVRRAEAAVLAYDGRGGGMSFSAGWKRIPAPRCKTDCWDLVTERPPGLPRLTGHEMKAFAVANGATCDGPRPVPERLQHRFRHSIYRFRFPAEWSGGKRTDFLWRLATGEEQSGLYSDDIPPGDVQRVPGVPGGFVISF